MSKTYCHVETFSNHLLTAAVVFLVPTVALSNEELSCVFHIVAWPGKHTHDCKNLQNAC